MTLLAAFLLVLGVVDLVRWSPEPARRPRAALALAAGAAAALALAVLLGAGRGGALAVLAAASAAVLAAVPLAPPAAGALGRWWSALDLPGLGEVPAEQALAVVAGGVFLLASANRVVRAVLSCAGTPPGPGEATLRGGRLLGPLERTFILALALAGDLTAAAVVIAAKGVLRLPEIRSAKQEKRGGADVVTEYFLVGTFTSWLLAVAVAGLVRLAG